MVAALGDVLSEAVAGRRAAAGMVVLGWEDARAYVRAAEDAKAPLILQAGPGCRRHTPIRVLGTMFRELAERAAVPVVAHVDHAKSFEECREGIEAGFTSVMIDGSALALGDNIALTRSVVDFARRKGVAVEGEVGIVGYANGSRSTSTDPAEAERFASETGVDALAISVGNVHLQKTSDAQIDDTALLAITERTRVPLVIHGGSGVAPQERRRMARERRVAKFNIGTELRQRFGASLRKYLELHPGAYDRLEILAATEEPLRQAAAEIIAGLWWT